MRKISRRSFLSAAAVCGAAAALTACGGSSSSTAASSTASSAAASSAAADGQKYTVGICQLVEHAALDAATQGFEDALTAQFGENVTFDFQNAQNDSATCATIANGFVSAGVDLIMANATPALQAAQAATDSIPILGTSVTEYGVALGLTDFDGTVGGNVSGTSDLAPLDQQADMITEWLPEATKVGLLYCSAEANSQYQVDEVQKYLSLTGHMYDVCIFICNTEWFESLPEEYQTIIMEEAANAREIELQENDESVILQRLEDAGMEVNEVDKEAFVERMSDIWARFDEEYGEEWIDLALAAQE